jgi:hypothetical protein
MVLKLHPATLRCKITIHVLSGARRVVVESNPKGVNLNWLERGNIDRLHTMDRFVLPSFLLQARACFCDRVSTTNAASTT